MLILSWLRAKPKHLEKFCTLYTDLGFDVLVAHVHPLQVLWPPRGAQLVASDIVKFLVNNEYYERMLLHGFSVGGYLWGECLVQLQNDLCRREIIAKRIKAQQQ